VPFLPIFFSFLCLSHPITITAPQTFGIGPNPETLPILFGHQVEAIIKSVFFVVVVLIDFNSLICLPTVWSGRRKHSSGDATDSGKQLLF